MAGSVTGIKAGKAFVLIEAVDATGKVLGQIRNKLGKFGTELSSMGRTMAMRAIAALTPVGLAVKFGTAYDDIMRKVEARSEGTNAEMTALRDITLSLGQAMGVLPSSIGGAMNILAQAGFSRKEIAAAAPAVIALARSGGELAGSFEDTTNAANIVRSVLRSYDMDASNAADVADKLSVALRVSNYDLKDIGTTLEYAAVSAAEFGFSLDSMLQVTGAMRDFGIEASIAGTAYRNMNKRMSEAKNVEAFNESLNKLTGKKVQFLDDLGNLRNPLETLPALVEVMKELSTAQRSDLFQQLFEMRASTPAAAAGRAVGRMADIGVGLDNFKGDAKRVQQEMDTGLGGAFRRFVASLEATAIKLTEALAPSLGAATEHLNKFTVGFTDFISTNQGAIAGIVASVMGFLALGTALVVIGQASIGLSALFGIGAMLASATGYLLAFVAPWALAAAGIWLAVDAVGAFKGNGKGMIDVLQAVGKELSTFGENFRATGDFMRGVFQHLKDDWITTFSSILDSLSAGDLSSAFTTLTNQLKITWTELVGYMINVWHNFLDLIERSQHQGGMMLLGAKNGYLYNIVKGYSDFLDKYGPADPKGRADRQKYLESFGDINKNLTEFKPSDAMNNRHANNQANREALDAMRADSQAQRQDAKARQAIAANDAHDLAMLKEAENRIRANPLGVAAKKKEMEDAAHKLIGPGKINNTPPKGAVEALDMRSAEAFKAFAEAKYAMSEDQALKVAEEARDFLASIDKKVGGEVGVMA